MNDDFTEADEHRIWRAEDDWAGEYPTTRARNFTWEQDEDAQAEWMGRAW